DGRPVVTAGDWNRNDQVIAFNPSYFAPYAYRVFASMDHAHDWLALIGPGYRDNFAATASRLGTGGTASRPPDWVGIDRADGALVPLPSRSGRPSSYGYDAARTWWRVALDLRWGLDGRARAFLDQAGFLRRAWLRGDLGSV